MVSTGYRNELKLEPSVKQFFTGFREGEDCTIGFMSIDRIDLLLGNGGNHDPEGHYEAVFPEAQFTCSGRLVSWVFGAEWEGNTQSFTELQIWRPVGDDGVYTKVGSTTIDTPQNRTHLYYYPLSSPLAFQAGDVLGYYQPSFTESQLRLLYEEGEAGELQLGYYFSKSRSPATDLDIRRGYKSAKYNLFINVVTGEHNK